MRTGRNTYMYKYKQTKQFSDMKQPLDYKMALKAYAEEAVASLYWCNNPRILVDKDNHEVDFLDTEAKKSAEWKPLWKVLTYYPYTTVTYTDHNKETSQFNFTVGDFNDDETRGIACLLRDVWFGYVEKKYHKADNKTALKIQNRLTGQIVYLGWYDGVFKVTELPPRIHDSWINAIEINED